MPHVVVARRTNDNKVEDIEEVTDKHDNAQAVQLERNLENKEIQQHLGQSTDKYNRVLEPERARERESEREQTHILDNVHPIQGAGVMNVKLGHNQDTVAKHQRFKDIAKPTVVYHS